jgi:hypothetical protein
LYDKYDKVAIINDIIYVIIYSEPIIYKYTLLGETIGFIPFVKTLPYLCHVKILNEEIVVFHRNNITFYDLDGNEITSTNIDRNVTENCIITRNNLYVIDEHNCYKYHTYERTV